MKSYADLLTILLALLMPSILIQIYIIFPELNSQIKK